MKLHLLAALVLGLSIASVKAEDLQANLTYHVANVSSGKVLRPLDAGNQDGNPIVLYSCVSWKCVTWKFVPAGNDFQLQNLFTSKTFAGSQDKAQFVLQTPWKKDAAERPAWSFVKLDDGSYKIVDPKSGQALTAVPDDRLGTRVALRDWKDTKEQKWTLQKVDPKDLTM